MSLRTWADEFYPVDARDLVEQTQDHKELIAHALRKWEGLRKEHLDRHGLYARQLVLHEKAGPHRHKIINASSCTLCLVYGGATATKCSECPLTSVRGMPCDYFSLSEDLSPWGEWPRNSNPEPMIKLLEEALKNETI